MLSIRRASAFVLPLAAVLVGAPGLLAQADAPDGADDAPPAAPPSFSAPQVPDSIQALVQEYQAVQSRLASAQQQALQESSELQEQRDEIQVAIEDAMIDVNPEIEVAIDRIEELSMEAEAAQQAQDRQRMVEIQQEAAQLQQQLQSAQAPVMEQPEIQSAIEDFQNDLMDEMIELEPETEALIGQLETLGQRVQAYQQSMQGTAPSPPPAPPASGQTPPGQ